jgi:putative glycosyltransferase
MKLSVVTTVFYSESYLYQFHTRVLSALKGIIGGNTSFLDYEIIFVNDGSPDNSISILENIHKADQHVKIIELSRNFGHHQAIKAGLSAATGDWIFLIDCDLEEAPELLSEFWKMASSDTTIDVVYGIQKRRKGNWFEAFSGSVFYKLLNSLIHFDYPHDTLTARLMNRNYVNAVLQYPEKALEIWSIFLFAGFNQVGIPAEKLSKGSSTYTFTRKLRMAIETITATSNRPLYFIFLFGILIFLFSGFYLFYIIYTALFLDGVVQGWASTIASIWLVGGITFLLLGIIAIYLAKIFQEVKNRPVYIVKNRK